MNEPRTRLAPSPTGALHLGNARTFLVNWALARLSGWRIILRIEDLDGPRIKKEAGRQAIETLQWLGLDWDEGPFYQIHDLTRYHAAMRKLGENGLIYPCRCSRTQIANAQSAPHSDEHDPRYPGACRPAAGVKCAFDPAMGDVAWRIRVPDEPIIFHDDFHGPQSINVQQTVGDFIVATRAGLPAYQLAVVVDDAHQGVTHVVRGDDLLTSTPRQIHIHRSLGLAPLPNYFHLPLVLGPDGRRLAKRHGDTRLSVYRQAGVTPERIIGLIADWCGMKPRRETTARQFAERFTPDTLPQGPVTFTADDHSWLMQSRSSC